MSAQPNYFKIGVFVIAAAALAVTGVVLLGAGAFFRKTVLVETYIDESVQGLEVGSPVKYRGVQVGKVDAISWTRLKYEESKPVHARKRYVLVEMAIYGDQREALAELWTDEALRIRLSPQGLTGLNYLEVEYVGDPRLYPELPYDWDQRHDYVPWAPSVVGTLTDSVETISRTLKQLEGTDIGQLTQNLDTLLVRVTDLVSHADMESLREETVKLLVDLRKTNEAVRVILEKPETQELPAEVYASAQAVRQLLDPEEGDLVKALAVLSDASQKAGAAAEGLPDAVAQFEKVLRRLNAMIDEQQQILTATLENVEAVTANLRDMSEDARRYPARVLFGEPPPVKEPKE